MYKKNLNRQFLNEPPKRAHTAKAGILSSAVYGAISTKRCNSTNAATTNAAAPLPRVRSRANSSRGRSAWTRSATTTADTRSSSARELSRQSFSVGVTKKDEAQRRRDTLRKLGQHRQRLSRKRLRS